MPQRCKYNPYRNGHAPGHLRAAVLRALFENCDTLEEVPWWSKLNITFFNLRQQVQWETWDATKRGIWMTGQLWNCRDILPGSACALTGCPQGSTYARLVRKARKEISASPDRVSCVDNQKRFPSVKD